MNILSLICRSEAPVKADILDLEKELCINVLKKITWIILHIVLTNLWIFKKFINHKNEVFTRDSFGNN